MLQQVRTELKNSFVASAQFVEDALARHVHFSNHLLESSLASAKAMRASSSLTDALKIPPQLITQTQKELLALGYSNTQAVLGLGKRCAARLKQGLKSKAIVEEILIDDSVSEPVTSLLAAAPTAPAKKKTAPRAKKSKSAE